MARICVPVCVSRADELLNAVRRAAEVADLIELRLDCLNPNQLDAALRECAALREAGALPFILTFRPSEQGGRRALSAAERIHFWSQKISPPAPHDLYDVELELLESTDVREQLPMQQVICSHHDFTGMPPVLERLYERMRSTSAAILKVAVQADDVTDCIPILKLLKRARSAGREMIAVAMGQAGVMTRILGPSRGSYLTYGPLDDERATAAGQLTARELREIYRIDQIDRQTQITGVIGNPIGHSLSPHIHNAAFAQGDANAVFIPFEVNDLEGFIERMVCSTSREIDWNLRGLSVTAPHKTAVMKNLDWIEPAAKEIGAVNTVVIEGDQLRGYNTDARAFVETLKAQFGSLAKAKCAVIGAGGAARAAIYGLNGEGAAVTVFARNRDKAEKLSALHNGEVRELADSDFAGFDVVINATPLGTRGKLEAEAPATATQLRGVRLAYDLVYNPLETQFMREARAAGCEAFGGLEMLIAQAVEQFRLWTGAEPDVDAMRAVAERELRRA